MKQRLVGYDLARAIAIFGMVIVNFKIVMHAAEDTQAGWLKLFNIIDGRASALFVILAGVGLSLMVGSSRASGDMAEFRRLQISIFKRAGFLFVFGLLYIQIWPADILHYYGVYLFLGAGCLLLSTRSLWWLSGAVLFFAWLLFISFDYSTAWNWQTLDYADFHTPAGFFRHLFFNGFHPVLPWLAFLLLGIVLGRQNVQHTAVRERLFLCGLLVMLLAEGINLFLPYALLIGLAPEYAIYFSTHPMPPLPLYLFGSAGSAIVIMMTCIAAGEKYGNRKWLLPFIYTGQLALTLYLAHVLLGMGVLEGLGLLQNQSLAFAVGSAVLFCLTAVIFASYWRKYRRLGPLEWLLRRASE